MCNTYTHNLFFTSKCVLNSHSSPVHRSQSFHTTNMADLETLDYSSEEEPMPTLPIDPMITSTHSDILDLRPFRETMRRQAVNNDVVMAREYVAGFQVSTLQSNCQISVGLCMIERKKTFINCPKDTDTVCVSVSCCGATRNKMFFINIFYRSSFYPPSQSIHVSLQNTDLLPGQGLDHNFHCFLYYHVKYFFR